VNRSVVGTDSPITPILDPIARIPADPFVQGTAQEKLRPSLIPHAVSQNSGSRSGFGTIGFGNCFGTDLPPFRPGFAPGFAPSQNRTFSGGVQGAAEMRALCGLCAGFAHPWGWGVVHYALSRPPIRACDVIAHARSHIIIYMCDATNLNSERVNAYTPPCPRVIVFHTRGPVITPPHPVREPTQDTVSRSHRII
jgi:hypothetical protein